MDELFDTTNLRQAAALRRHVAAAGAAGQGDLFAEPGARVAPVAVASFAWPAPVGALWTREDVAGMPVLA
jgi:hypothetical protein